MYNIINLELIYGSGARHQQHVVFCITSIKVYFYSAVISFREYCFELQ